MNEFVALALEKEKEKNANKRHTLSNPPEHIPDLDSPRQSRSPLKKDKKEKVSENCVFLPFHVSQSVYLVTLLDRSQFILHF